MTCRSRFQFILVSDKAAIGVIDVPTGLNLDYLYMMLPTVAEQFFDELFNTQHLRISF